jgi:hypothetical protein
MEATVPGLAMLRGVMLTVRVSLAERRRGLRFAASRFERMQR